MVETYFIDQKCKEIVYNETKSKNKIGVPQMEEIWPINASINKNSDKFCHKRFWGNFCEQKIFEILL